MADNVQTAPEETTILNITPIAIDKIKSLMAEKELVDYGLRVFIAGGGCSGFQYGMAFENSPREDDYIIELQDIKLIVDPMSLPYIHGSHIDFVDNLMGGGFRIDNPNAVSTCGCGNSFRTADSEGGHAQAQGGGCGCH